VAGSPSSLEDETSESDTKGKCSTPKQDVRSARREHTAAGAGEAAAGKATTEEEATARESGTTGRRTEEDKSIEKCF